MVALAHMSILEEDLEYISSALTDAERTAFNDSTVLITGCAGSLGFELVRVLLDYLEVREAIGIDNLWLGKPPWIEQLKDNPRFTFYEQDITAVDMSCISHSDEVDFVFHMASIASPMFYRRHPLETMDANVVGCRKLLEHYRGKGLQRLVFFSSSEVYGSPDDEHLPMNESDWGSVSCLGPRACYDESKRYTETICEVYDKKYHVPCVILRPFNIFGPGMKLNDRRAPADFAQAVLMGRDLPVYSDGCPTRTFCYISDAIAWILKSATCGHFDVFNIGADDPEVSIREFASRFEAVGRAKLGYQVSSQYLVSEDAEYLVNNPRRRCPDLTHSSDILHFRPRIGLDEAIERYLAFFIRQGNDYAKDWTW